MKSVSVKAILIGGIVDIGGSMIAVMIVMILAAGTLAASNGAAHAAEAARALATSPQFRLVMHFLGGGVSILAGYVAARIARHDEVLNGALSSWLCLLLAAGKLAWVGNSPSPEILLGFVVSPLLGAAGGYLRARGSGGRLATPAA